MALPFTVRTAEVLAWLSPFTDSVTLSAMSDLQASISSADGGFRRSEKLAVDEREMMDVMRCHKRDPPSMNVCLSLHEKGKRGACERLKNRANIYACERGKSRQLIPVCATHGHDNNLGATREVKELRRRLCDFSID